MSTSYFPGDKAEEVGKKYLEIIKKYPPDRTLSKPVLRVGVRTTADGFKAITISEVKEGKFNNKFIRKLLQKIIGILVRKAIQFDDKNSSNQFFHRFTIGYGIIARKK